MNLLTFVALLITLSSVQGLLWGSKGSDETKRSDRWLSLRAQNKTLTDKIEHYIHFINTKVGGDGIYFSGIYREEGESDKKWFGNKNRFYKAAQISELAADSMHELYDNRDGKRKVENVFFLAKHSFEMTILYLDDKLNANELLSKYASFVTHVNEFKSQDWASYLKELQEYYSKFKNREGLLKVIRKALKKAVAVGFLFVAANLFWGFLGMLGLAGVGWTLIKGAFPF